MAEPFIRQAGGKRQLADRILEYVPDNWNMYVEPFLGGGAIFFALWHKYDFMNGASVFLGDADHDLYELWKAVRDDVLTLEKDVRSLIGVCIRGGDAKRFYLDQRELWNSGDRTPARHLFLRRACFNGLWRQNKKGHMNTPWKGEAPKSPGTELMRAMAALQDTELLDWDFRQYESDESFFIGPGTLVYLDPPYLPDKPTGFTKYLSTDWLERDLIDLLRLSQVWHDRGAHIILSHADNPLFRTRCAQLWPQAEIHEVQARRAINSDGDGRGPVPELIVVGRH